jgi:hypothetical protein
MLEQSGPRPVQQQQQQLLLLCLLLLLLQRRWPGLVAAWHALLL